MGAGKMITSAFLSCLTQTSYTSLPVTGSRGKELVTTSASIVSLPSRGSGRATAWERVDLEGKIESNLPSQQWIRGLLSFRQGRSLFESIHYVSSEQENKDESLPIILGWKKVNCVANKICWEGCRIGVKIGGLSHALKSFLCCLFSVWTWASYWTSQGLFS